jgi:hypothetical protein
MGESEHLILSSDSNIYFATNCNTIGRRVAVCLNTSKDFYPMTDNSGSIGTSSYRWSDAYFVKINGVTPKLTDTTYSISRDSKDIKLTDSSGNSTTADAARSTSLARDVDLNDIVLPGFYNAGGGNSCTNTPNPSSTSGFGLIVLQTGGGAWYY